MEPSFDEWLHAIPLINRGQYVRQEDEQFSREMQVRGRLQATVKKAGMQSVSQVAQNLVK